MLNLDAVDRHMQCKRTAETGAHTEMRERKLKASDRYLQELGALVAERTVCEFELHQEVRRRLVS